MAQGKGMGRWCVVWAELGCAACRFGPAWEQLGWGVLSGPAGEGEVVLGWVGQVGLLVGFQPKAG